MPHKWNIKKGRSNARIKTGNGCTVAYVENLWNEETKELNIIIHRENWVYKITSLVSPSWNKGEEPC